MLIPLILYILAPGPPDIQCSFFIVCYDLIECRQVEKADYIDVTELDTNGNIGVYKIVGGYYKPSTPGTPALLVVRTKPCPPIYDRTMCGHNYYVFTNSVIFSDGFETGDVSNWSFVVN